MNKKEAIKLLADNRIYQLNKGESLLDAIEHVTKNKPRKGYKVRHDNGQKMTKNQIISNENKQAFKRSFTPATYTHDVVESIDDICDGEDLREDKSNRGMIANCYYCGVSIRIDGDGEDYSVYENVTHCEECMNDAILNMCL